MENDLLVAIGGSGGPLQLVVVICSSCGGGVDLVYWQCYSVFMDQSGGGDGCSRVDVRWKWSRQASMTRTGGTDHRVVSEAEHGW